MSRLARISRADAPFAAAAAGARLARWAVALVALLGALMAHADEDLMRAARRVEANLAGFPQRTVVEIAGLRARGGPASPEERRYIDALDGQARAAAGDLPGANQLADSIAGLADAAHDEQGTALALLIRSAIASSAGDTVKSMALAREAREIATDPYLRYWAALTLGTSARSRGMTEEGWPTCRKRCRSRRACTTTTAAPACSTSSPCCS